MLVSIKMEFKSRFPLAKSMPDTVAIKASKRGVSPTVVRLLLQHLPQYWHQKIVWSTLTTLQILRDQLPISTWLLIGASAHGALSFLLPRSGVYVSSIFLSILIFRIVKTALQSYGILHNPEMDEAVLGKVSAQIPDLDGNMPTQPSQEGVVVLMLGIKSNQWVLSSSKLFRQNGELANQCSFSL